MSVAGRPPRGGVHSDGIELRATTSTTTAAAEKMNPCFNPLVRFSAGIRFPPTALRHKRKHRTATRTNGDIFAINLIHNMPSKRKPSELHAAKKCYEIYTWRCGLSTSKRKCERTSMQGCSRNELTQLGSPDLSITWWRDWLRSVDLSVFFFLTFLLLRVFVVWCVSTVFISNAQPVLNILRSCYRRAKIYLILIGFNARYFFHVVGTVVVCRMHYTGIQSYRSPIPTQVWIGVTDRPNIRVPTLCMFWGRWTYSSGAIIRFETRIITLISDVGYALAINQQSIRYVDEGSQMNEIDGVTLIVGCWTLSDGDGVGVGYCDARGNFMISCVIVIA